jgi:hypothetical protein
LKILHSSWCFCMVVQCSRTMLDKLLSAGWYVMTNGTLLFAFFSFYIGWGNGQCQQCDSRRCMTCKNIKCTQKFRSTHTGEKFIIYCNANCKTRSFLFILDEVFSVNTTCFVKTMVNARIVVTPLFQMTF